ncbi:MAG: thiamine-monophosphate kinase [Candidatus Melainabacteria bacterium]|nr:thiamine-monophosphate kinase [Candidatus Melainabacteria bacterium]
MTTEQEILKVIRAIVPNSKKFLFDDAAIIEKDLIVTTDTLVENTHFTTKTYTPEEIGWKALAVNLSDIAAMGGKPLYALVSLSLPAPPLLWIKKLYKGILSCAKKYKTQIIGGNLARSKEINITITLIGKTVETPHWGVSTGKRSNAKPGDLVFVTGTFGYAAKKPIPQIKLGQKIIKLTKRCALMDSSDGLADCLIQISNESKVKIIIDEDKIPISKKILYSGEDYQLVGTASKEDCRKLKKIKEIKIIGEVETPRCGVSGAFLKQKNNKLVKLDRKRTYEHFK